MRCSRWPSRSCWGERALGEGGALGRDGAAIFGAAGGGGAAIRGIGRGAMAGCCGGGAGRNAGAAGRAIAGGGAGRAMAGGGAGRAMAGGGAGRAMAGGGAGRAMVGGGAAGRAAGGPCPFSWADEVPLAAIAETPRKNAAKRTPSGSMIVAPRYFFGRPTASMREFRNRSPIDGRCGFATQAGG
jgi:hypothetical protein